MVASMCVLAKYVAGALDRPRTAPRCLEDWTSSGESVCVQRAFRRRTETSGAEEKWNLSPIANTNRNTAAHKLDKKFVARFLVRQLQFKGCKTSCIMEISATLLQRAFRHLQLYYVQVNGSFRRILKCTAMYVLASDQGADQVCGNLQSSRSTFQDCNSVQSDSSCSFRFLVGFKFVVFFLTERKFAADRVAARVYTKYKCISIGYKRVNLLSRSLSDDEFNFNLGL